MGCNMGCGMGSVELYRPSVNFIIESSWFCLVTTFALCCACSLLIAAISSSCFIFSSSSSCYCDCNVAFISWYLSSVDLATSSWVSSLYSSSLMCSWDVDFCLELDDAPMLPRNVLDLLFSLRTSATISISVFPSSPSSWAAFCLSCISFCNMIEPLLVIFTAATCELQTLQNAY